MKKIFCLLFACVALTAQAKVIKRIKSPESMLCLGFHYGGLKPNEVIMTDTATTIKFTMTYRVGEWFSILPCAYLKDETGNRYPLRSSEGLKLDDWIQSPESGMTDFTLHFAPMPKGVKMFDFIEGEDDNFFKVLGIHDSKMKLHYPTVKELLDANPYTLPTDWLKTDTITIKGRIEGYDKNVFGSDTLTLYNYDVLAEKNAIVNMPIKPDGTFVKHFCYSSPLLSCFYVPTPKNDFRSIPFFARPGETIDITVRKDESDKHICVYNNGSSKDVCRLLKTSHFFDEVGAGDFDGKAADFPAYAKKKLDNMLYYLDQFRRKNNYTPLEVRLALAQIQTAYTLGILNYTMMRWDMIKKWEQDEQGMWHANVTDSAELAALTDLKLYAGMKVFDYNNPLVLSCGRLCSFMSNYLWYSTYVKEKVRKYMGDCEEYDSEAEMKVRRAALRELLGGDKGDSFVAQLSVFDHYKQSFDRWSDAEQKIPEVMADSSLTEEDKKSFVRNSCLSGMHPIYMSAMTHPYIHNKAEIFSAEKLTKNLTWELPKENVAADIVRSIAARYPGRYLVIDFWGMGCGPCRSEIQASKDVRSKIAKRDDVKLVYIADENIAGGSESYRKYVAEWLDGEETMCVSDVTFNAMEELFEFTAIPHKVIITPEGLVVDDALSVSMHDFDNSFENVKKRLNK